MSRSEATLGQATHSLNILNQQGLKAEHFKVLHDGYLADLAQAIKNGTLPSRNSFRQTLQLGLAPAHYRITVDFRKTLEQLLNAPQYGRVDLEGVDREEGKDAYLKNTLDTYNIVEETGENVLEFETRLIPLDLNLSGTERETGDWLDAGVEHLFVFGTAYPTEQLKFSIFSGDTSTFHVPYLTKYGLALTSIKRCVANCSPVVFRNPSYACGDLLKELPTAKLLQVRLISSAL